MIAAPARRVLLVAAGLVALALPGSRVSRAAAPHAGTILFVTPCTGDCTYTPGADDATLNQSSLPSQDATLSEFAWGDASWSAVVSCLEALFAPFDVAVTTTDPGSTPHTELAIAGIPSQLGQSPGVAAIAPFSCAFIGNAPGFVFANTVGDEPERICWMAAQQAGAMFGLDIHFACADVMTYLDGCGAKAFLNQEMACGEFAARACCDAVVGNGTQNSYERLVAEFGENPVLFVDGFEAGTTRWSGSQP